MSIRGQNRETNEDSIALNDTAGLYIVADGMGGHERGDLASSMAVEEITAYLEDRLSGAEGEASKNNIFMPNLLQEAVAWANRIIFERSRKPSPGYSMGTTLSLACILNRNLYIAHVGDSRIYRLRQGCFKKLTHDHSWVQELVDQGRIGEDEAINHPLSNIVTRALGTNESVEVDTEIFSVKEGDSFLLCSDGLLKALSERIVAGLLASDHSTRNKCETMIEMARREGSPDDVSLIILEGGI